jgi:ribose transport system permease protein
MTAAPSSRTESIRRSIRARLKPVNERWVSFSRTRLGSFVSHAFSTNPAWIFLLLIALMFVFNFLAPGKFFTEFNVRSMAVNVSVLLVIAVGETFVMATGGIDLSVGYVLLFSGVTSAQVMNWGGHDPTNSGWDVVLLGLAVAIGSGLAWGVLNGLVVAKAKVPALIATLGTLGMSWGLAEIFSNGQDLRYLPKVIADLGADRVIFDKVPLVVIVAVIVAVIGAVILNLTKFGRYTLAIGSNQEAARRAGINVDRHLIKVYAMSGTLAGFAGFMSLAIFTTTTISGHANDNLQAIAAVVIGGTSLVGGVATVVGTTIGVCIPMVLFSGFTILGYQSFWRDVAVGAVLILAVYADQLRRRRRERR